MDVIKRKNMIYCDFAIVGSGPSGVAAARKLEGRDTIVFDVGNEL